MCCFAQKRNIEPEGLLFHKSNKEFPRYKLSCSRLLVFSSMYKLMILIKKSVLSIFEPEQDFWSQPCRLSKPSLCVCVRSLEIGLFYNSVFFVFFIIDSGRGHRLVEDKIWKQSKMRSVASKFYPVFSL